MPEASTPVATCHQVLADGRICQSPALRKQLFCYYHSRQRDRSRNIAASARRRKSQALPDLDIAVITSLHLPTPDDPVAIQVCIAGILQAMMTGALSGPLGGRLLYGLHLAKCNYREVDAFNERHQHPASALDVKDTIAIAATDPEPIAPLDASGTEDVTATSDAELDLYAQVLEIAEIPVPDPDSAYRQFEDEHTEMLHGFAEALLVPEGDKQEWLELLESDYLEERKRGRQRIVEKVYSQLLDARYASPKESAAAHGSQSQVAGSQKEREEQIA